MIVKDDFTDICDHQCVSLAVVANYYRGEGMRERVRGGDSTLMILSIHYNHRVSAKIPNSKVNKITRYSVGALFDLI